MKNLLSIHKIALITAVVAGTTVFTSCEKDDSKPAPVLHLDITHRAGSKLFALDSTFTTPNGDQFTPSLFKYYISNISLIRTDNSVVDVPETYFLVDQSNDATLMPMIENAPVGDYKGIRFLIGVDSTRNTSGAQSGALDPANGMFWTWSTGYIFYKLEGTSPSIASPGNFRYHVGGFEGTYNNIRQVELDFDGDILSLKNGGHPELHLILDVLEVFQTPTLIDMSTFSSTVMSANADAQTLADNYADMFRYDHIHEE